MGRRCKHPKRSKRNTPNVQVTLPSTDENAQHESETHLRTSLHCASRDERGARDDPYEIFTIDDESVEDVNELIDTEIPSGVSTSTLHPTLRHVHELINSKIGLSHAVKIRLQEITHTNVNMQIYEAGILLCISTFIKIAKEQGCLRSMLNEFPPATAVRLVGFATRLQEFMRRASSIHAYIPQTLSLNILPNDAPSVWNTERDRVVRAVNCIDLESKQEVDKPDWHANAIIFLFKKSAGQPRVAITCIKKMEVTIPLKCGICFEPALESDACNADNDCKYLICSSCRQPSMKSCPFCRNPW